MNHAKNTALPLKTFGISLVWSRVISRPIESWKPLFFHTKCLKILFIHDKNGHNPIKAKTVVTFSMNSDQRILTIHIKEQRSVELHSLLLALPYHRQTSMAGQKCTCPKEEFYLRNLWFINQKLSVKNQKKHSTK